MAALYTLGAGFTTGLTGTATCSLKAGTTSNFRLYEFSLNNASANTLVFGFGRPANDGSVVQSSTVTPQPENAAEPATGIRYSNTWTTAPTVPPAFLRRSSLTAANGYGFIWTFPRGLNVYTSKDVVVWTISAAASAVHVQMVLFE